MTTFTYNAYRIKEEEVPGSDGEEYEFTELEAVSIDVVLSDDIVDFSFNYEFNENGTNYMTVSGDPLAVYEIRIDGVSGDMTTFYSEAERYNWGLNNETDLFVLVFDDGSENVDNTFKDDVFVVEMGGDSLNWNSLADFQAWFASVDTDEGGNPTSFPIIDGPFAIDSTIRFDSLDGYVSDTTDDVVKAEDSLYSEFMLGDGNDTFFGSSGGDTIHDGVGDDTIYGGGNDDTLLAGSGADYFNGGSGDDTVVVDVSDFEPKLFTVFFEMNTGDHGAVETETNRDVYENVENYTLIGDWDARITGSNDANIITTDLGDDRIYAAKGNDEVHLGAGDDYVRVGGGAESFYGGDGIDYISYYSSSNGVTLNLATNSASGSWAANDIGSGLRRREGSKTGGDRITGTSGANVIKTYGGNDVVYGGRGNDRIELGSGNDYVRAGGGAESFYGGFGTDYISYYDSSNGVTINLGTNTATGSWAVNDIVEDFEGVSGSKTGGDRITGTSGANVIKTYGGNDSVFGGNGNDRIELGSGNDYVKVGGGAESFYGGSGKDYISYYDSSNGIRIDLRDDEVSGSWATNDVISDFEGASGSKTGNDTMLGTNGANTLRSYGGDDKLYGRSGGDKLYGGAGEDFFDGGGGSGIDLLYGGADADVFHFDSGEGIDVVKDFENNIDTIQLDNFDLTKSEAFALATQDGSDVIFDFGSGGMLTIENTTIGQLQNDLDMV